MAISRPVGGAEVWDALVPYPHVAVENPERSLGCGGPPALVPASLVVAWPLEGTPQVVVTCELLDLAR